MSDAGILGDAGLAPPARTLWDVLLATSARHPDASALDDGDGALSYRQLVAAVEARARELAEAGVARGDRVGIRMPSGRRELYIAILAVLRAGAAYVPVDLDDPEERAELVFGEAGVAGIIGADAVYRPQKAPRSATGEPAPAQPEPPTPDDDAWIIFTSGSTGVPKGVAVTHRSAAAFVDAEALLFLQGEPLGPSDRVLAGLSVAFDASCEEMWLAWRSGACLVPAPRALVRTGMDLGPWLLARRITAVSTVPTLAQLWPADSLENVRLLIFGGEACPPELAARLADGEREVWNTYGPTEATVVACGALLTGEPPIRIGLPLDGWTLAVVDADGRPVAEGETGELVIGGVGLARYLDPAKDAEKYAPMPSLGWQRAYRSGDLVRLESAGLVFLGRADDQVKIGGRRIELGEVDAALQTLPGVAAAASAVRTTDTGRSLLVGYVAPSDPAAFDRGAAIARLREELPAALVPLLAVLDELPTRTSGKVDRAALPWPLSGVGDDGAGASTDADPELAALAADWQSVLGVSVADPDADFFELGGGSLAAAQLVGRIRERDPEFAVALVYEHPRLGAMAELLATRRTERGEGAGDGADPHEHHSPTPTPRRMQWAQTLISVPLHLLAAARWVTIALTVTTVLHGIGSIGPARALIDPSTGGALLRVQLDWGSLPTAPWWLLVIALVLFVTPFGRMLIAVALARALLRGVRPGDHPRGGSVHLRLWAAEQAAHLVGAASLAGAPWISYYARALGATIGRNADLHSLPPVTGLLTMGEGAAIEPEVDLSGWWIDGDILRLGAVHVGRGATVGARSTLLPGTRIGRGAEIAPGSAVFGKVPAGQLWAGSPAERIGATRAWWPEERPPAGRVWLVAYGASSVALSLTPVLAAVIGGLPLVLAVRSAPDLPSTLGAIAALLIPSTLLAGIALAALVVVGVRALSIGLREGVHPVRSRIGWQAWATERLMDLSRTILFPIYSSLVTPVWLRLLGARVGTNVEASTVLLIPSMTTIRDEAFLADDTLVAPYELGGGWLRIAPSEIGRRAFLGNSGIAGSGRRVPREGLVAVLSAAPEKSKRGSSWLGSPAVRLQRQQSDADAARTYAPPTRLRVARALWEACRVVPVFVSAYLGFGVVAVLLLVAGAGSPAAGFGLAILVGAPLLIVAGALAAGVSTLAKWTFVGRIRAGEHPLWSSFVWRTEVADTFTEMVAAPWFANSAAGTPALAIWLRSLGARLGRGVWCETYWLPEADLVELGDGATVNRGCVVQTHLFHDRIMSMDEVRIDAGGTLGPHSVILPAASIATDATVGPASLVMRGESVPRGSRWSGNPIGPWREVRTRPYGEPIEAEDDGTPVTDPPPGRPDASA